VVQGLAVESILDWTFVVNVAHQRTIMRNGLLDVRLEGVRLRLELSHASRLLCIRRERGSILRIPHAPGHFGRDLLQKQLLAKRAEEVGFDQDVPADVQKELTL